MTTTPPSYCPSCRQRSLHASQLEPLLPSHACDRCGGNWVRGEEYLRWLDRPDRNQSSSPEPVVAVADEQVHDSKRAMLCPDCGRLLARFRVGHGLEFFIDHCGGCGGIWLDSNEWQALKQARLDDRIHRIFSAAWQAQILREQQRQLAEQRLRVQIGQADFEQLARMTQWIESHQHRSEIAAYLLEHLRATSGKKLDAASASGER